MNRRHNFHFRFLYDTCREIKRANNINKSKYKVLLAGLDFTFVMAKWICAD